LTEWVETTYGADAAAQNSQSSGARSGQLLPADAVFESARPPPSTGGVVESRTGELLEVEDTVLKSSGADPRFEIGGPAEPDHDTALTPGPDLKTQDPRESAISNLVVTPIVSGTKILAGLVEAVEVELTPEEKDAAGKQLMVGMSITQSEEYQKILACNVSALTIYESAKAAEVKYAGGGSESDSIRDHDSGPGKIRWHRRKPYHYRREPNENEVTFRRRMRFKAENTETVHWDVEAESDDEGRVMQESFVLTAQKAVDESGEITGPPAELQGYISEGASNVAVRPWEKGFLSVRDGAIPFDDTIDHDLIRSIMTRLGGCPNTMEGHGAALTELCRLMDMGHVPHAIGEPRNAEVCGAC